MRFSVQTEKPSLENSLYSDKDVDFLSQRIQELEIERYLQDTKHRKTFAWWVMILDSVFLRRDTLWVQKYNLFATF